MTDAYRCNRCGVYEEGEMAPLSIRVLGRSVNAGYPSSLHLCNDCRRAFAEFMEGGE